VAGDAVNPSLGAWPRHPCRGHPCHRTHPAFGSSPRSAGKAIGVGSVFPRKTDLTPFCLSSSDSFHPRMAWIDLAPRHRETVGGGAVWACRTVGAMDGAIEPPWVRALCLRSTASQAPERAAAGGWAGPRSGVYGVSCKPAPPRQPTECSLLLLLLLRLRPLQVQGRRPCRTPFTPRRARPAAVRAWCRAAARRSSSRSA